MSNYLPATITGANGADFTIASGGSATLSLSAASGLIPGCGADIQIKAADLTYQSIGRLDRDSPILVLQATGTFRVVKGSNTDLAFGVEKD